jgi:hypothetical protein
MAAAKKKSSASPFAASVRGLFSWMVGPGRLALVLVLLFGLFAGGAWYAWTRVKDRILASPEYRIPPEQVEVTPQPAWIPQSNVRGEVLCSPSLDGPLSITDDDVTERIAAGFARHPWVAKVERVTKQYGGVKVELVYRKPVCMVQLPGGGLPLPVDATAVLLPTGDFTPLETRRYPQLLGVDREPTVLVGSRWTDAKVIGGAEIAAALGDLWESMRLHAIEPSAADPALATPGVAASPWTPNSFAGRSAEPFFTLITDRGSRILWGYAPGANAPAELPAAEKVARLKRYVTEKDSLDGPEGKPQQLDVRTLRPSAGP